MSLAENYPKSKIDNLSIGIFLSIVFFCILFMIKNYIPDALNIDAKWLILACSPVLIALIISGYIKSFKTHGVEFEFQLSNEVGKTPNLYRNINYLSIPMIVKGSRQTIEDFTDKAKQKIQILTFYLGKHYDIGDIDKYLSDLPSIKYFLVLERNGNFSCLVEYSKLKKMNTNTNNIIEKLTNYIHDPQSIFFYSYCSIEVNIKNTDTIIFAYNIFNEHNINVIPVTDSNNKFLGIIKKTDLYKTISDSIVLSINKNQNYSVK